jgi:C-terminal processing protease CtpA/Prc
MPEKGLQRKEKLKRSCRTPQLNKEGYMRIAVRYDEHGNILEKVFFGLDGKPIIDIGAEPIDGIGAKARYSYADGNQPVSVVYLDEHDRVIPVEVEVNEIVADSTAARVGLLPGDRLLSYAGEKLRSAEQLIFLTGKAGAGPRKLTYRRGKNSFTVEVPPGRLGVVVSNVRAAFSATAPVNRR